MIELEIATTLDYPHQTKGKHLGKMTQIRVGVAMGCRWWIIGVGKGEIRVWMDNRRPGKEGREGGTG